MHPRPRAAARLCPHCPPAEDGNAGYERVCGEAVCAGCAEWESATKDLPLHPQTHLQFGIVTRPHSLRTQVLLEQLKLGGSYVELQRDCMLLLLNIEGQSVHICCQLELRLKGVQRQLHKLPGLTTQRIRNFLQ